MGAGHWTGPDVSLAACAGGRVRGWAWSVDGDD